MSRKALPLHPRDDETLEGSRAIWKTKSERELEGDPKAKKGRASITSKNNEQKWKNERKKKERKKEEKK
jgi:hypothetical protein